MSRVNFDRETDLPLLRSVAKSLTGEVAQLRAERAQLAAQLAEARARAENAERERAEIEEVATAWQQELQLVREQLDERTRQLYGKTSERRPSAPGAGGSEEPEADAAAGKPTKRKKQKGHGRTAQPDLATEDVVHDIPEEQRACPGCGGELTAMGTAEEAELVALEERRIVLQRHLRMKYSCRCCRDVVVVAPGPVKLVPGGRYALNFVVAVAFMKYFAHVPLDRQVHIYKHEGLAVRTSTLCDQLDALATALANTYQAICAVVQAEPVLRADETPWDVLSNGHTANERFYAWVAVGSRYVAYKLLDTRSAEGVASILGPFAGTLVVDGLTSYPAAAKAKDGRGPKFVVANCWVHARRKFIESEAHYPADSRVLLDMVGELYVIEREAKEGGDRALLRDERSRPVVDRIFDWARAQQGRPDILEGSTLARALGYLLNHEPGLRVFLDNPAVPIDNNESEQAMRPPVLGRKNFYGSRSRDATQWAAIIFTLVESAKRVGVSPRAYLEAAAEHALRKAGAVLLPDEFKAQLAAARDPTTATG